jgi:hypothetical protein
MMSASEPHQAGQPVALRDLLYLDVEKAASLLSQIERGLAREIEQTTEAASASTAAVSADLKLLASKLESTESERRLESVRRVLHHDLAVKLEEHLFAAGVAVDLNEARRQKSEAELRDLLGAAAYIRVEGYATIEDYERLKLVAGRFNDLQTAIARSAAAASVDPTVVDKLDQQMREAYLDVHASPEGKQKAGALRRAVDLEAQVRNLLLSAADLSEIPTWLVQTIELWIDTFMPGRLSVRLMPFDDEPDFQIIAELRRSEFTQEDLDVLRLTYGTRPDRPLTVFGLVSAAPPIEEDLRDFLAGLPSDDTAEAAGSDVSDETARAIFERAFRGVFVGAEGLEAFVRFSRYPGIVVQPVSVYRTIRTPLTAAEAAPEQRRTTWQRLRAAVRGAG